MKRPRLGMRVREGMYWASVGAFTATIISVGFSAGAIAGTFFILSYAFLLIAAYPKNGR